eukprot:g15505.t1
MVFGVITAVEAVFRRHWQQCVMAAHPQTAYTSIRMHLGALLSISRRRYARRPELQDPDDIPSGLPPGEDVGAQTAAAACALLSDVQILSSGTTRQEFLQAAGTLASAGLLAAMGFSSGVALGGSGQRVLVAKAAEAAAVAENSAALLQKEVLSYIREALPGWRSLPDQDIQLKQITGGITNVIFKARNLATGEGALVRVYGKDTDLLLDRTKEAAVFSELSTLGFGPKLLGKFKGGR